MALNDARSRCFKIIQRFETLDQLRDTGRDNRDRRDIDDDATKNA